MDASLVGASVVGLERSVTQLRRAMGGLSDEVSVIKECLVRAGIASSARLEAYVHRRRFSAMCRSSNWRPGVNLLDILQKAEIANAISMSAGLEEMAVLAQSSFSTKAATDVVSAKIYVCGGYGDSGAALDSAECFHACSGSWRALPSMRVRRAGSAAAVCRRRLIISGGVGDLGSTVQSWNASSGKWEFGTVPSMPSKRHDHVSHVFGGHLYVCGGCDAKDMALDSLLRVQLTSDVQRPAWESMRPMREGRALMASSVIGGRLFIGGGHIPETTALQSTEEFDPLRGVWSEAPHMLVPRVGPASAALRACMYVCGGEYGGTILNLVERFDPAERCWSPLRPMAHPRQCAAAAAIGDVLYIIGGAAVVHGERSDIPDSARWSTVECFDLRTQGWHAAAPISAGRLHPSCAVVLR